MHQMHNIYTYLFSFPKEIYHPSQRSQNAPASSALCASVARPDDGRCAWTPDRHTLIFLVFIRPTKKKKTILFAFVDQCQSAQTHTHINRSVSPNWFRRLGLLAGSIARPSSAIPSPEGILWMGEAIWLGACSGNLFVFRLFTSCGPLLHMS